MLGILGVYGCISIANEIKRINLSCNCNEATVFCYFMITSCFTVRSYYLSVIITYGI